MFVLQKSTYARTYVVVFSVMIDGEETWTKTNSQAEQFSNVAIFAGDGWRDPQPGKIKSFRVNTKESQFEFNTFKLHQTIYVLL